MATPADYGWYELLGKDRYGIVINYGYNRKIFELKRVAPWWWPWLDRWALSVMSPITGLMMPQPALMDVDRAHYHALDMVARSCVNDRMGDAEVQAAEKRFIMKVLMRTYPCPGGPAIT